VIQALRIAAVIGVLTAAASGQARADVVLSGPDSNAGSYSTSALASVATSSDTVSADGLTGISLWGLLGGASASSPTSAVYGDITTSTPAGDNGKNAILRYYLLASGGSQQSAVSLGEIDPAFGGTAPTPAFVAFQHTGGGLLAAPELIVPSASGRDVANLTGLQLLSVPALPAAPIAPGGQSTSVQLAGQVTNPGSYTLATLKGKFAPVIETIAGDTYTGVPLWTFLNASNSNTTSQVVVTKATDGYEVVAALAEIDPAFGGNPDDLLPYADNGGQFPGDGVARIIFPTDNKEGRWVSNVDAIVVSDVPEPQPLSLLLFSALCTIVMRSRPLRGVLDGAWSSLPLSRNGQ
jgi:hypothetical protein